MRHAYLAQDRADLIEAIKCLARGMSKSGTGHMIQLKRVSRYVRGVSRKAQQYSTQEKSIAHLEVLVDSDWAGDTVTRRSTTGVIVIRGQHLFQTQLNGTKCDWSELCRKSVLRTYKGSCRTCLQTGT